jgi:hypothetical protein
VRALGTTYSFPPFQALRASCSFSCFGPLAPQFGQVPSKLLPADRLDFSARLSAERAQRISQSFLRLEDSRATRPAETVGGSYCFLPAERLRRNYADRAVIFRHKEKTEIAGARGSTVRKSRSVYSGRIPTTVNTMGDKSRKEVHKKALQKRIKDDAAVHEKQAMTEDQHHPTSGHTATPGHPTTSDERDPPRPQTDQPSGKNERRMDRPKK